MWVSKEWLEDMLLMYMGKVIWVLGARESMFVKSVIFY